MPVRHIDHILIAMPAGREDEARAFYLGILGLDEKVKPPQLAARGGCWFESGHLQVHLGVEKNFIPARKAHPAFIVDDLVAMITKAMQAGYKVTADELIEGCDRRHIEDPFGNRIELIELHAKWATAGRYNLGRSDWGNSRPRPEEHVSAATAQPTGNRS
jgi:catechol 2,3-dioxygenase-like lactoylglutathione lyase family enzyme